MNASIIDRTGNSEPPTSSSAQVSPNRAISTLILLFAGLSLATSALPLWPGVTAKLPFEILERRFALSFYGQALIGFILFLYPLTVPVTVDRRVLRAWWWVGHFVIAFAVVPLLVLAYIAGVHRDGALAIALAASFTLGLASALIRLFGVHRRHWVLGIFAVWAVACPIVGYWRGLLNGKAASFWRSLPAKYEPTFFETGPFPAVQAIAERLADPPILPLVIGTLIVHGLFWFPLSALTRRRFGAAAVVACILTGGVAAVHDHRTSSRDTAATDERPSRSTGGAVVEFLRGWVVPGAPYPMRLDADRGGVKFEVDVAGRMLYAWTSEKPGGESVWIYPPLAGATDDVSVAIDGGPKVPLRLQEIPTDRSLLLFLHENPEDSVPPALAESVKGRAEIVAVAAADSPPLSAGYRPFAAVVASGTTVEHVSSSVRSAVLDFVRSGGTMVVLGSGASERPEGLGRILEVSRPDEVANREWRRRDDRTVDPNAYGNFRLPSWDMVDLTKLLLFLVVYHVVFYLVFLLPLLIDSKKSVGVYVVSVGFVSAIVVVGGWFSTKRVFFREHQILQQNIGIYAYAGGWMTSFEETCFASFNAQPGSIKLDQTANPQLVFEHPLQSTGRISVRDSGRTVSLDAVPLDLRRRKQIVRFTRVDPSPFTVEQNGPRVRFLPLSDAADVFGLNSARFVGGFVRYQGELYGITFDGRDVVIASTPESKSWQGVCPEALLRNNGLPILRTALGRYAPPESTVLCVLVEDMPPIHREPGYLAVRDICRILFIPLDGI